MMQIPQLHKRMPDTLPKDWRLLPTGYFTHQLVGLPNPLDDAPESPDRIEAIEARLMLAGLEGRVRRVECGPAPREAVLLAHDSQYVDDREHASLGDPEALKRFTEPDTQEGEDTFSCAMASAGAVVGAVDAIYGRSVKNAFCAVRPPGHHASRSRASGFCYLNNAAIGALWAQKRWRAERVMVISTHITATARKKYWLTALEFGFCRFSNGRFFRTDAWSRRRAMRSFHRSRPVPEEKRSAMWWRTFGCRKSISFSRI